MGSSIVSSVAAPTEQDRAPMCCSFQATSFEQAAALAADLQAEAARAGAPGTPRLRRVGDAAWIVTLTTPAVPLRMDALEPWDRHMRAVEHRWVGCRFLGWKTCRPSDASHEGAEPPRRDAPATPPRSQRWLVIASLLRCPPDDRRGIVHGRGIPG